MDFKPEPLDPIGILISAFALSSVGGLAALLRSNKKLTMRVVVSAVLYSGIMGLVMALISYRYFGIANPYFLLGVCGLAGIGGTTVIDFMLQLLKSGGISIHLYPKSDSADKES